MSERSKKHASVWMKRFRNFWGRTSQRDFERWCAKSELRKATESITLAKYLEKNADLTAEQGIKKFKKYLYKIAQHKDQLISVNTYPPDAELDSFDIDFTGIECSRPPTPNTLTHFSSFVTEQTREAHISGAIINKLYIQAQTKYLALTGCYIGSLEFANGTRSLDLFLQDCWIGTLVLNIETDIKSLFIEGGTIRSIQCPPPDGPNPFSGSVSISGVKFPTSRRSVLLEGAQAYRSMRTHFEKLQNAPTANLMRALELATERKWGEDRGFRWLVSWAYGTFAKYGTSPGRPLLWAAGLCFVAGAGIFLWDGGTTGLKPDEYTGWRQALVEPGVWGDLRRSLILPLQSTVNPFGMFGARKLVVAATGWGHFALSIQGFLTDVLLAMSIFGIRKRFKL